MNKLIISTILAAGLIINAACNRDKNAGEGSHEVLGPNDIEVNADQYQTAGIRLGKPEVRDLRTVVKANGQVNAPPQRIASVSAPLGGFVKSTVPVQGSAVTKGQVLATLENMAFIELEQSYLETKARYNYAEIEYKRHSELYKENVYSEKNVQQTETEYKTLKSQLRGLEQKLLLLGIDPAKLSEDNISGTVSLTAPISGFVRTVNVNIGKYVNPTDVLFEIVDTQDIILELTLFEKDVQEVSDGQKLTFSTPNDAASVYTATIYQAGRTLDDQKTSRAYARIANPDHRLLPGMFINAEIETSSRQVSAVPQEAVVQFDSVFYIFAFKGKRIENGKEIYDFEAVKVKKGATDAGFTEVILPAGTLPVEIVIKGAYAVLSAWKNAGEMAC